LKLPTKHSLRDSNLYPATTMLEMLTISLGWLLPAWDRISPTCPVLGVKLTKADIVKSAQLPASTGIPLATTATLVAYGWFISPRLCYG
jgi:hypothetical protein